nr:alpha/beta family hydrolase [Alkalilimnicola ehrlichii]
MAQTQWLVDGPAGASTTVVLAHGAGAAMDSEFMNVVAQGLAGSGLRVVRFEFPYMVRRREDGRKRPPDRQPVLLDCWRAVVQEWRDSSKLIIGGKSMGGGWRV